MDKTKIYLFISSLVLLIGGLVSFYFSRRKEVIDRFEGPIPFVFTAGVNKTVRHYITTKPSRYVLFIGGPAQSGKSRLIDILAQESSENNRLVLKIDAGQANSIEDFMNFLQVSLVRGLTPIRSSIDVRTIDQEFDEKASINQKESNQIKTAKLYQMLKKSIDDSYSFGFSERSIHKFFNLLESVSDKLNPIIFIHNYDRIIDLGTDDDPKFGLKLIESVCAYLSRRNLYTQNVPIVLELKNSLYSLRYKHNSVFRYFEMEQLSDAVNFLVDYAPVFNLFELKKVIKNFGAHGGSIAKVFECLRYGMKIDEAIDHLQNLIKRGVHSKLEKYPDAYVYVKRFCDSKGVLHIGNRTEIEHLAPFFDGYLYLSKNMQIMPSNKAVVTALCE